MKTKCTPSLFSMHTRVVRMSLIAALMSSAVLGPQISAEEAADGAQSDPGQHHSDRHRTRNMDPEALKARTDARFAKLDADGDGLITETELLAAELPEGARRHAKKRVHMRRARMDHRSEGTSEERRRERQAELYKVLDTNGDGTVSEEEFANMDKAKQTLVKQHIFVRMDANEDGVIARDEFKLPGRHRRSRSRHNSNIEQEQG